jgi:hypothetical protein
MDMTALIADLDGIRIEQNDKIVQQKSRDFYWYSPVLKEPARSHHRRPRRLTKHRRRTDPRAQGLLPA